VVDVAFNVNRSVVGVHAGDVLRAVRAVKISIPGAIIVATVATNDTAAAVLTAALASTNGSNPALGDIAIVESFATWESLARAPRYNQDSYYAWVNGVLRHFDLPDLLAATALISPRAPRLLVISPTDAARQRLSLPAARSAYSFATAIDQDRLELLLNATTAVNIDAALIAWLHRGVALSWWRKS